MDFTLSTYFNSFDADKEYPLEVSDIDSKLESVIDSLANNPEAIITNDELFEEIIDLAHGFPSLDTKHQKQFSYLITSSFNSIGQNCYNAIEQGDFVDQIEHFGTILEKYGYIMFVLLIYLGKEDHNLSGKSRQPSNNAKWKANCTQVEDALAAVVTVLKIDISKIFVTTPERNLFIELFIRPIFRLMEVPERMKVASIKMFMFKNICLAVKYHGHSTMVKGSILQGLTYYIHLPNYMAELLHTLNTQFDYNVLTEEVLRDIAQIEFNSNDSNGPKSISEFLVKLSELNPRLILKQLSSTAQLLDNSNQTLRCSVVETCGNIVIDIIKSEQSDNESADEHNSNSSQQIDGLLNLLQERFLDQNPYVRTKAIQALVKVCNLPVKFPKRRQIIMLLAVRSLDDKSTLVRRNSIKLMCKLILTHPFSTAHGSQLSHKLWKAKLDEAEAELNQYIPISPIKKSKRKNDELDSVEEEDELSGSDSEENGKQSDDMDVDEENQDEKEADDEEDKDENDEEKDDENESLDLDELNESMIEQQENLPDTSTLLKLKLKVQYYQDAVLFIEAIHKGADIVSRLLFSKNRNEVLESMDFLVLADAYDIQNAQVGIRRMLHLVWMKGSSDEGKSIASHLIDCYKDLFLTVPNDLSPGEAAAMIAHNLIGLTYSASVSDLASLEKLLCLMYDEKLINQDIIKVLWQVYSFAENNETEQITSKRQSHGAIILLGMLALADNNIVLKGFDPLLRVGLGDVGKDDLVLCKYSCLALQRVMPATTNKNQNNETFKIDREDEAIERLTNILLSYNEKPEWYTVAEQAIGAIYRASSNPDEVCSDIIKSKTKLVFAGNEGSKLISLSQLLFIVGHIAIKTIVHLEELETLFKKKKHDSEAANKKIDNGEEEENNDNELEMIGGTSEDDFTDAVIYIKERELLFGENSLLARFGPLVKEICSNNKNYDNEILQRSAVLCMNKLMCVSSKYCEDNLPLLITIMEKSPDPIIRCNCVLGLGDMAVCFNNLVDENTDFLYRRLTDENIMVQRTCLMTVTFLILAGQVKVKGQLSSMAKCLENSDQSISDMCRLFFTELATKDNAIYNGFIDIFSGLSNDDSLSKDAMKRIVKFLVGFIEKEKHQKQLSEKLLVRLMKCQSESQWNDVAFVLSSIPYKNEAITTALEAGYKMVLARD